MIRAEASCLVVVDIQPKLLAVMRNPERLMDRTTRLLRGARLLGVPILFLEQNPEGLGETVMDLRKWAMEAPVLAKQTFGAAGTPSILGLLERKSWQHIVICGIETHVCVAQTAMGLMENGLDPVIALDATTTRNAEDAELALFRFQQEGVRLTGTEALLFEWMERADVPEFKEFLEIVK